MFPFPQLRERKILGAEPPWWSIWVGFVCLDCAVVYASRVRDLTYLSTATPVQAASGMTLESAAWIAVGDLVGFLAVWPTAGFNTERLGAAVSVPYVRGRRVFIGALAAIVAVLLSAAVRDPLSHWREIFSNLGNLCVVGVWVYSTVMGIKTILRVRGVRPGWVLPLAGMAMLFVSRWSIAYHASMLP